MIIKYKLTSQNKTTHNNFKLPEGKWFYPEIASDTPKPCTNTVLHYYDHPLLAALFNKTHANYDNPRLFEIEIDAEIGNDGLKGWCLAQRVISEMPLPAITTEQRIEFAIRCAMQFCTCARWLKWSEDWLSDVDRSEAAAEASWKIAKEAKEESWVIAADASIAAMMARSDHMRSWAIAARAAGWAAMWRVIESKKTDFLTIIQKIVNNHD